MTDQDYERKKHECWEEYKRQNLYGEVQWQPASRYDVFCAAFDRAYALGKQETKQETKQEIKQETDAEDTVISGWVARDGNGPNDLGLRVYTVKPDRRKNRREWNGHGEMSYLIDCRLFPDLTWESDPEEVEIIIKRKKK